MGVLKFDKRTRKFSIVFCLDSKNPFSTCKEMGFEIIKKKKKGKKKNEIK